jgi:hypothetical protein
VLAGFGRKSSLDRVLVIEIRSINSFARKGEAHARRVGRSGRVEPMGKKPVPAKKKSCLEEGKPEPRGTHRGKLKCICMDCNSWSHGKVKGKCVDCNPCPHGKLKRWCAECSPCPQGKVIRNCMACDPCSHDKLKRNCVDCNYCPHGKCAV